MTSLILFSTCTTPYGDMIAARSTAGLCRLLPPGTGLDDLYAWAGQHARTTDLLPDPAPDPQLQQQIDEYFAGKRHDFSLPLDLRGTPFQRAVWQAVCDIPYGETRSYADIARTVGRPGAWRAVGAANAINPVCLIIPCHRVIGADGTLKGYAGGVLNRRILLELEAGGRKARAKRQKS
jgi:O-6-methylguanine DNA methyltransferase